MRGPLGLPIERDLYWEPKTVGSMRPSYPSNHRVQGFLNRTNGVVPTFQSDMNLGLDNATEVLTRGMRRESRWGITRRPPAVVERVRSFLRFPTGNANVLDPCCGEGLALESLADGANATTYGIEPDAYRADQARGILDHVSSAATKTRLSAPTLSHALPQPAVRLDLGRRRGQRAQGEELP